MLHRLTKQGGYVIMPVFFCQLKSRLPAFIFGGYIDTRASQEDTHAFKMPVGCSNMQKRLVPAPAHGSAQVYICPCQIPLQRS